MNSSRGLSEISRWVLGVILAIIFAFFLIWCFGSRVDIYGHSMSDTLKSDDTVLVDRLRYKFFDIKRFDIVCFKNNTSNTFSVKRVVGLPGETVKISGGIVYVDGNPIEMPNPGSKYNLSGLAENDFTLGDGEYFLLGDNGDSSEDSRFKSVGAVKESDIEGKIWFGLSPFGFISTGR